MVRRVSAYQSQQRTDVSRREPRWVVRGFEEARAREFAAALGISPFVAGLLLGRGVEDASAARTLLRPALEQLHDPYLMLGMREAVERVLRAIDAGERILIYGDYDVDGTTGTVVLRRALDAEVNGVWSDETDGRQRIGVKLLDQDGWFAE